MVLYVFCDENLMRMYYNLKQIISFIKLFIKQIHKIINTYLRKSVFRFNVLFSYYNVNNLIHMTLSDTPIFFIIEKNVIYHRTRIKLGSTINFFNKVNAK